MPGRAPQDPSNFKVEPHMITCTLIDRKSTRLNSSHLVISYAVFCLKKKKLLTVAVEPPRAPTTEFIELCSYGPEMHAAYLNRHGRLYVLAHTYVRALLQCDSIHCDA